MSLINTLSHTGIAIITPFNKDESIDFDSLSKLIDFNINNGVNYIVSLGTTGETPCLNLSEKKEILDFTFEKVNGRVPVVVGIGGNNTKSVIQEIHTLPIEKATAILSASPNYNKPTQEGIFLHYKSIAQNSPKPILLYNVPGRTGRNITSNTISKLANEVENIEGIKEATDNIQQCMEIVRDCPKDFLIVSGDDALCMSQIALGFKGVISVTAQALPSLFTKMINLSIENKFEEARKIQYKLLKAYDLMFEENNPAGIKGFLYELDLIENITRLPVTPCTEALLQKIKDFLHSYN